MPICIECSYPVSHLYSAYSRADDRSQGKGVRLTQCPRCQRFADKYVEYDFVVLFIDLVLIKPQVYRHLLFNRLGRDDNQFDRSIIRLGVLLLLFDVYLTWARIEKDPSLATTFLSRAPIIVQYLFFLSLNAAATLAHHLTVRLLASILVPKSCRYNRPDTSNNANPSTLHTGDGPPHPSGPSTPTMRPSPSATPLTAQSQNPTNPPTSPLKPNPTPAPYPEVASVPDPSPTPQATAMAPPRPAPPLRRTSTAPLQNIQSLPPPTAASPAAISTALLVSSCAKLFPILLVIWGADGSGSLSDNPAHRLPGSQVRTPRQPATMPSAVHETLFATVRSTPALSSAATISSRISETVHSASSQDSWLSATASLLWNSGPTSYLTGLFDLLASLLSLGVVDTHLVLLSNIVALYILLGCGYVRAVVIAVAGQVARWAVQKVILGAVGVG
ncbi:Arv1 protein [Penicillium brevicompactum]|uniref:Arv1 protein n=1 Tax=Penicillium brevicompactum TaxID=5074 RepID=UPI002541548F|nr:Arv1 protein [Penicillium brevicompactum]KAJ5334049.1 Arv1 protein [Penicillium brevicompactum]